MKYVKFKENHMNKDETEDKKKGIKILKMT